MTKTELLEELQGIHLEHCPMSEDEFDENNPEPCNCGIALLMARIYASVLVDDQQAVSP